jgi:hypothetical protein
MAEKTSFSTLRISHPGSYEETLEYYVGARRRTWRNP